MLTPVQPVHIENYKVRQQIRFTRAFGDMPMVSILSCKYDLSLSLNAFSIFNLPFVHFYFCFMLFILLILFVINRSYADLISTIRISLHQAMNNINSNRKTYPILINFLMLTLFFHIFFSSELLNFFTLDNVEFKINSLSELISQSDLKIIIFEGEVAETLLTNSTYQKNADYQDRIILSGNIIRIILLEFSYLNFQRSYKR